MNIVLAIFLGGLFGMALFFAGASNPSKLTAMLRLEYLTLMKIIVFAIGFASILVSLSCLPGIFSISHFNIKSMNLGVVIGGLIFGLGFGWAGTCPGTCVAGLAGIGYKKAFIAVIGGLLGAFCYSITYRFWNNTGIFHILNYGKITMFQISEKYPFVLKGSYFGLLIIGILFVLVSVMIPMGKNLN